MSNRYDPGPQIAQCGTINLGVLDLEKSLWFYRDILGMEDVERDGDVAYLRAFQEKGHHSLVLSEQDEAIVNSFSFRTKRPQDVELFYNDLVERGLDVREIPAGTELGRGEAIRFLVPGGEHPFELYYDIEKPEAPEEIRSRIKSNSSTRRGLGVRRIDHYNVQTSPDSINEAEAFARDVLGFKRREFAMSPDNPDQLRASWMSVTPQVHDLAMVANGEGKKGRLHHLSYNLENFHDVLTAADVLKDLEISYGTGPGKHGIGQAMYLYVFDPGSDHRIELYGGGYLIFDPDWEALEWKPEEFTEGMTWYGDPIDTVVGSRGRDTTGTAGIDHPFLTK